MACGYIHCPCCGYDTVATDDTVPELCSECETGGCELDGSDPQCECGQPEQWVNPGAQHQDD